MFGDLSRVEMWKLKLKESQHLCCKVTWPNKDSKLTERVTTFDTCKITVWRSAEMHIKIAEKELNISLLDILLSNLNGGFNVLQCIYTV